MNSGSMGLIPRRFCIIAIPLFREGGRNGNTENGKSRTEEFKQLFDSLMLRIARQQLWHNALAIWRDLSGFHLN